MGKVLIITKITKRGGWPALWAQDYNIIIMPIVGIDREEGDGSAVGVMVMMFPLYGRSAPSA
jgi:hypothetical protein